VAAGAERVPEPGRHAAELLAVGRAVEDVPALTAPGDRDAVRADELVRLAEVLAHAECQVAARVERQPGEAVVRVVPLRVEERDARLLVGLAAAGGVAEPEDFVARGDVDGAVRVYRHVHRVIRSLEERGELVGTAVTV